MASMTPLGCDEGRVLSAAVPTEEDPRPDIMAKTQPRCVSCGAQMILLGVQPKRAPRRGSQYRYELHTFKCDQCGRRQTHTMGASGVAAATHRARCSLL